MPETRGFSMTAVCVDEPLPPALPNFLDELRASSQPLPSLATTDAVEWYVVYHEGRYLVRAPETYPYTQNCTVYRVVRDNGAVHFRSNITAISYADAPLYYYLPSDQISALRGTDRRCIRHGDWFYLPSGAAVVASDTWSARHGLYFKLSRTSRHYAVTGPSGLQTFSARRQRLNSPDYIYIIPLEHWLAAPVQYTRQSRARQRRIDAHMLSQGISVPNTPEPDEESWWTRYTTQTRPEGRHWLKIGAELEGGWNLQGHAWRPLVQDRGGDLVGDGSLEDLESPCIGEIRTKPHDSLEQFISDVHFFMPEETNESCGFHIHVSFTDDDYARLIDERFYFYFLLRWQKWGQDVGIRRGHEFWLRLEGDNTFCHRKFVPDNQVQHNDRGGERYAHLNYCYNLHGTVECRLLPMFADAGTAASAARELVSIFEDYLSMTPAEPFTGAVFQSQMFESETLDETVTVYESAKNAEIVVVETDFPEVTDASVFAPRNRTPSVYELQAALNRGG